MRHKTNLSRVTPCVRVNITQPSGVHVTGVDVVDDKLVVACSDGRMETIPLPTQAGARGVVTGRLVGSNLELVGEGDVVLATVALESLIPATKADRFLSNVAYDQAEKQLVFTTEAEGEDAQTITVPMADVIPGINAASTTQRGIVELATATETQTGTATNLAVTPAGLTSALTETKGAVADAVRRIQALEEAPKEECTPITLEPNQELRSPLGEQSDTLCQLADGSVVVRQPKRYVYTVVEQDEQLAREDIYVDYNTGGTRIPIDRLYYDPPHQRGSTLFVRTDSGESVEVSPSDLMYYVAESHPRLGGEVLLVSGFGAYRTQIRGYQDDEARVYTKYSASATAAVLAITGQP